MHIDRTSLSGGLSRIDKIGRVDSTIDAIILKKNSYVGVDQKFSVVGVGG